MHIIGFLGLSGVEHLKFQNHLIIITTFMAIVCIGFCFQSSVLPIILNEILPERGVAAANFISFLSITIGAIVYPFFLEK